MNIGDKMSGIIGKKLGMSNIFGQDGEIIPVTAVSYTHLTLPTSDLV